MTGNSHILLSKVICNGNSFIILNDQRLPALNRGLVSYLCSKYHTDGLIRLSGSGNYREIEFCNCEGTPFNMSFNGTLCAGFLLQSACSLQDIVITTPLGPVKFSAGIHGLMMEFPAPSFSTYSCSPCIKPVAGKYFFVHGSDPHLVVFIKQNPFGLSNFLDYARELRRDRTICADGLNVHFVYGSGCKYFIRHYERGVEDETLSCGSGCISAAVIIPEQPCIQFRSPGGSCTVNKFGKSKWTFSAEPEKILEAVEALSACMSKNG